MAAPIVIGAAAAGSAGSAGAAGGAGAGSAGTAGGAGAGSAAGAEAASVGGGGGAGGASGGATQAPPGGGTGSVGGRSAGGARPGARGADQRRPGSGGQRGSRRPPGSGQRASRPRPGSEPGHGSDGLRGLQQALEPLRQAQRLGQLLDEVKQAPQRVEHAIDDTGSKTVWIGLLALVVLVVGGLMILAPLIAIEDLLGQGGGGTTQIGPGSPIPSDLVPVFNAAGAALDVDPYLLASVAKQESGFSAEGVNSSGCAGIMQIGVGGACGDTWDEVVTLQSHPSVTVVVHNAYKLGSRPPSYGLESSRHPDLNDAFDAVMAAAVVLRGKVGGKPIPSLDNTAYQALCGYYGACADAVVDYASEVLDRAKQWESESALNPSTGPVSPAGYVDPFHVSVIYPERIDQGVDYALAPGEPIGALGAARVTGTISNWYLGQPLIWYQLLTGPYRDDYIYLAEQITGLARVGQMLLPGQPVAYYAKSGTGIETGWAIEDGETLAMAKGGYAEGRSTAAGASFWRLLRVLGAPVCTDPVSCVHTPFLGTVPPGYP